MNARLPSLFIGSRPSPPTVLNNARRGATTAVFEIGIAHVKEPSVHNQPVVSLLRASCRGIR